MRGARIAAAAAESLFDVTVVLGGQRPAGIAFGAATVVELPPVKAGPSGFSTLVAADGRPFDEPMQRARRDRLLSLFDAIRPDILLIEAFPFGRRAMRFELVPLLDHAVARRPRPLIASSIRDILQDHRDPRRDEETIQTVRRCFDRVLVHGDPSLVRLDDSFPRAAEIADRLAYTGIVAPTPGDVPDSGGVFDVIVSVGGGAVGAELIATALAARPQSALADAAWLVLAGPNMPPGAMPARPEGVTLWPYVADLPARLRRARLSISQAGYNTVADLMMAPTCRPVLVPYVGDGETEQTRRAALLDAARFGVTVEAAGLTPARLIAAIDRALGEPPGALTVDLAGAPNTAALLLGALREHSARLA